jgi:hypothetical protein
MPGGVHQHVYKWLAYLAGLGFVVVAVMYLGALLKDWARALVR